MFIAPVRARPLPQHLPLLDHHLSWPANMHFMCTPRPPEKTCIATVFAPVARAVHRSQERVEVASGVGVGD